MGRVTFEGSLIGPDCSRLQVFLRKANHCSCTVLEQARIDEITKLPLGGIGRTRTRATMLQRGHERRPLRRPGANAHWLFRRGHVSRKCSLPKSNQTARLLADGVPFHFQGKLSSAVIELIGIWQVPSLWQCARQKAASAKVRNSKVGNSKISSGDLPVRRGVGTVAHSGQYLAAWTHSRPKLSTGAGNCARPWGSSVQGSRGAPGRTR